MCNRFCMSWFPRFCTYDTWFCWTQENYLPRTEFDALVVEKSKCESRLDVTTAELKALPACTDFYTCRTSHLQKLHSLSVWLCAIVSQCGCVP